MQLQKKAQWIPLRMGVTNEVGDSTIGRVEVGAVRLAMLGADLDLPVFLAHEFVHVVHQLIGGLPGDFDEAFLTSNLPLFSEGLATYLSGLTMDITYPDDYRRTVNYSEYENPEILDPAIYLPIAQDYLDNFINTPYAVLNAAGSPRRDESNAPVFNEAAMMEHQRWFSSGDLESPYPYKDYRAIGYYIGARVIEYWITNDIYTPQQLIETSIMEMADQMDEGLADMIAAGSSL